MRMRHVCVFVCAVMVLTRAARLPEAGTGNNQTVSHLVMKTTCPGGWKTIQERCFCYIPTSMSWVAAETNCLTMKAHLASVHNTGEYHEIQRLIYGATHSYNETWLGGTDVSSENFWLWSDGSIFFYTNWCRNEPNNSEQRCLQMNYGGTRCWDDVKCSTQLPSVCAKTCDGDFRSDTEA